MGDDKNSGDETSPLRTVASCAARAGTARDSSAPVTRCLLEAGYYKEPPIDLSGRHRLIVEPEGRLDAGAVVFDGVDPLVLDWTPHAKHEWVLTANLSGAVPRLEALVVNGAAIQRAVDFSTAAQPCFLYDVGKSDDPMPQSFACDDAARHLVNPAHESAEDGQALREGLGLPGFWFDEGTGLLHVARGAKGLRPHVQVKTDQAAFVMGGGASSEHVYLRGLHFFGHTIDLGAPGSLDDYNRDIRIERCRFMYHPAAIHLSTTLQTIPSGSHQIEFVGNILEFGEGSLSYKASAARIASNLFVGNSLSDRGEYTVAGIALHDVLEDNTFSYNGDLGGHLGWGVNHTARRNLWLGQAYLARHHGTAVHTVKQRADATFSCEDSWFLGPSLAASIRLEDSFGDAASARGITIRHNVFLGHEPLEISGGGSALILERNTGDDTRADPVSARSMNVALKDRNVSATATGSSSRDSGATELETGGGRQESTNDVCALLRACHPSGRTNIYGRLRDGLAELQPRLLRPLSRSEVRALDFRPAFGGAAQDRAVQDPAQGDAPGCWSEACERKPFLHLLRYGTASTSTTEYHPLSPVPGEIASKTLQCDNMLQKQTCTGPNVRELGTLVESVATCRVLCETLGREHHICCGLGRNFMNHWVCREHRPPYVLQQSGPEEYSSVCKFVIGSPFNASFSTTQSVLTVSGGSSGASSINSQHSVHNHTHSVQDQTHSVDIHTHSHTHSRGARKKNRAVKKHAGRKHAAVKKQAAKKRSANEFLAPHA